MLSTHPDHRRPVVADVSLDIRHGEIIGLVGESGSGKSTLCRAVARLLPPGLEQTAGSVILNGRDITRLASRAVHRLAPRGLAMVFQDPLAALNPVMRVGDQVAEAILARGRVGRREARRAALAALEEAGLDEAPRRSRAYPTQLSGGQRQRVVLAMALATDPVLLLADEATSSLDVYTRAQILSLLRTLAARRGIAVLFVSHDYGVIADICSRVWVMYGGRILESGPTDEILTRPAHPYTRQLIACLPSLSHRVARLPVIQGRPPGIEDDPPGCPFAARCDRAMPSLCDTGPPPLRPLTLGHRTACLREPDTADPLSGPDTVSEETIHP